VSGNFLNPKMKKKKNERNQDSCCRKKWQKSKKVVRFGQVWSGYGPIVPSLGHHQQSPLSSFGSFASIN
jgi:hypothetical protein